MTSCAGRRRPSSRAAASSRPSTPRRSVAATTRRWSYRSRRWLTSHTPPVVSAVGLGPPAPQPHHPLGGPPMFSPFRRLRAAAAAAFEAGTPEPGADQLGVYLPAGSLGGYVAGHPTSITDGLLPDPQLINLGAWEGGHDSQV